MTVNRGVRPSRVGIRHPVRRRGSALAGSCLQVLSGASDPDPHGIRASKSRDYDFERNGLDWAMKLGSSFALLALGGAILPLPATEPREARQHMVTTQIQNRGVTDEKVLAAMRTVPRHEFVPESMREQAYEDMPLPIGHEQTISQPFIVGLMSELLALDPAARVLEIGTGSGYQAAILSHLAAEVYTIEIVEPLAQQAKKTLARLGFSNVEVRAGNGWLGWPEAAPFDAIIVTCAPDEIPSALQDQLREGGRLVIPVGPDGGVQELYLMEKKDGVMTKKSVIPVRFVPMTGQPDA